MSENTDILHLLFHNVLAKYIITIAVVLNANYTNTHFTDKREICNKFYCKILKFADLR